MYIPGLDGVLTAFDGSPLKFDKNDATLRRALTLALGSHKAVGHESLKCYDIGLKIYNQEGGKVEMDGEQMIFLKKVITQCEMFTPIVKGQVIKLLNQVKDGEESETKNGGK